MKKGMVCGLFAALAPAAVLAQSELKLSSTEVVPGMYVLSSADEQFVGGAMALLTGDDGLILVDGGIGRSAGRY